MAVVVWKAGPSVPCSVPGKRPWHPFWSCTFLILCSSCAMARATNGRRVGGRLQSALPSSRIPNFHPISTLICGTVERGGGVLTPSSWLGCACADVAPASSSARPATGGCSGHQGFDRLRDLGLDDDEVATFRATFFADVMTLDAEFPRRDGEDENGRVARMEDAWMLRQPRLSEFGACPTVVCACALSRWPEMACPAAVCTRALSRWPEMAVYAVAR